jgi:hypothetical protein
MGLTYNSLLHFLFIFPTFEIMKNQKKVNFSHYVSLCLFKSNYMNYN